MLNDLRLANPLRKATTEEVKNKKDARANKDRWFVYVLLAASVDTCRLLEWAQSLPDKTLDQQFLLELHKIEGGHRAARHWLVQWLGQGRSWYRYHLLHHDIQLIFLDYNTTFYIWNLHFIPWKLTRPHGSQYTPNFCWCWWSDTFMARLLIFHGAWPSSIEWSFRLRFP